MSKDADDDFADLLITVRPPILGKTQVLLTAHALRQMKLRGITTRQALQVIRSPHEYHDADMGRTRARRIRAGGRSAIDVVYEIDSDMLIVVTAIKKLWTR